MSADVNYTHDPNTPCWVPSANSPQTDFPIQNLPFGVFRRKDTSEAPRVGVAIGDSIFDIEAYPYWVPRNTKLAAAYNSTSLNQLMALDAAERQEIRRSLFALFYDSSKNEARDTVARYLIPQAEAELFLPAHIANYTDFYASIFHATNVGSMFRPDNPLLPNYKYVPIGYHGRASSIALSGTPVRRPNGQTSDANTPPEFGPSKRLDYELELGVFVGQGNALGESIPISSANQNIFGVCLLNDWSARDIQAWEYQPLGPFLAKNFATTISPWVVTNEALAPFRVPAFTRPEGDPEPLPYLLDPNDQQSGGLNITLEVWLQSARMKKENVAPLRLSQSNFSDLYWTIAQMLTHHASNGCNLLPGDLLGSGTVSGKEKSSRGCLLELAWRGQEPVELPNGERRAFLEDGDEVILRGFCERPGFRRIGLGECRGEVLPAQSS
jgi:fumarylacetoacetase